MTRSATLIDWKSLPVGPEKYHAYLSSPNGHQASRRRAPQQS